MVVLKRIAAVVFVVSLLFSCMPVSAENTAQSNDDNAISIELSSKSDYETYLTNHSFKDYDGNDILVNAATYTNYTGNAPKTCAGPNKSTAIRIVPETSSVEWSIDVPTTAMYKVSFLYSPVVISENPINFSFLINGTAPYDISESLSLTRVWRDEIKENSDSVGMQSAPRQIQEEKWNWSDLVDPDGIYIGSLLFYFEAGKNKIDLKMISGEMDLSTIKLSAPDDIKSYEDIAGGYGAYSKYNGKNIVIQAQNTDSKSSKELRSLSDNTDPMNTPVNAYKTYVNYIGGSNWNSSGERITWKFDVKKSALYELSFRYRQTYLNNASSIRAVYIDGELPFSEAGEVRFAYQTNWDILTLGKSNSPYLIYLEAGSHELTMEVSLGDIARISRELESVVYNVGELYRQIIMITGTSPDANRDYRLYEQIEGLNERLEQYSNQLNDLADQYDAISNVSGGSDASVLRNLANVLERMCASKFRAHEYINDMFNNYSSSGAWVYSMRSMPLDIEKIILSAPGADLESEYLSNSFQRIIYGAKRLLASYTADYSVLNSNGSEERNIFLWVNLGRDQAQVLSNMIKDTFTTQTGITVNLKITTAGVIQAILSGERLDCTIMQERTIPVNLAMRGSLYDLSKFSDYNEVVKRYADGMITPYTYKNGVYGLPDTQTFYLMFVRDDVLDQFKLQVPRTWDEFLSVSAVLMRNNLSVGVPFLYTTFLYQFDGKLYNDDLTKTTLTTTQAIRAFEYMSSFYTEYQLPINFSFYNRFRTGEMPMGISLYTDYATLITAAPEIRGCWSIHSIPGIIDENGQLNNKSVGTGTASVILKSSKAKDEAWEFLKWWTDEQTQYRYNSDIESVLGVAARHPTANLRALQQMSWSGGSCDILTEQWDSIINLPEIPGGYYLTRALDNAFYSVYNDNESPKEMISKWDGMVNREITRKIEEINRIIPND